jgi:hypothetical protein
MIELAELKRAQKLKDLFEWYGIPGDSANRWELLAVALAKVHVPGMRIDHKLKVERRGRPRRWVSDQGVSSEGYELLRAVEFLRSEKNLTVDEALEELSQDKEKKWHGFSRNPEVLRTRYWQVHALERKSREVADFSSQFDPETDPLGGLYNALGGPFPTDENS